MEIKISPQLQAKFAELKTKWAEVLEASALLKTAGEAVTKMKNDLWCEVYKEHPEVNDTSEWKFVESTGCLQSEEPTEAVTPEVIV